MDELLLDVVPEPPPPPPELLGAVVVGEDDSGADAESEALPDSVGAAVALSVAAGVVSEGVASVGAGAASVDDTVCAAEKASRKPSRKRRKLLFLMFATWVLTREEKKRVYRVRAQPRPGGGGLVGGDKQDLDEAQRGREEDHLHLDHEPVGVNVGYKGKMASSALGVQCTPTPAPVGVVQQPPHSLEGH